MSRSALSLAVPDLSAFAKGLRTQLAALDHPPGHVEMLNACCRAAGYRNFQHFRSSAAPGDLPEAAAPDLGKIEKVARHFDSEGRMVRWPSKASHAELCLWVLWSRLPAGTVSSEFEISALLKGWNTFGDHALLRRAMVDGRLLDRTVDGRAYRRIEQKPPAELSPLLARLYRDRAALPRADVRTRA